MRTLLFGLALSLAAVTGCSKDSGADKGASADKAKDEFPAMSMDDVQKGIEAKTLTAVDCNGDRTRKKMGTLPGAIVVTDEETFAATELPADKGAKLVFYCMDPGWHACHTGAGRAKKLGYTNVYVMPDGIEGWVKAGKPVSKV